MEIKRYIRPGRGAADLTPLLLDAAAFRACIDGLAALFYGAVIEKVACVEGRGFLIGGAVAYRLGAGLIPVRDPARLKVAGALYTVEFVDYSGAAKRLAMQRDAVVPGERVLVVDDWVETGATVRAVIGLVEQCGGVVAGIATLIDDTSDATRAALARYTYRWLAQTAPGDPF